jgi:5-carboxymethyl-2-hydroxymuconate isomerase
MSLEVTSFEVTELPKFVERNIIDETNLFPNGSVEVKYSWVSTWVDGSEV